MNNFYKNCPSYICLNDLMYYDYKNYIVNDQTFEYLTIIEQQSNAILEFEIIGF